MITKQSSTTCTNNRGTELLAQLSLALHFISDGNIIPIGTFYKLINYLLKALFPIHSQRVIRFF